MTKKIHLFLLLIILLTTSCSQKAPTPHVKTTSPPAATTKPRTIIDDPPEKPGELLEYTAHDRYTSFCSYETHTVQIAQETFTTLDYEGCFSKDPVGEYIYKESWWDFYEILKPYHSSFTWWRYRPDQDWSPSPLEYHDPIMSEITQVIKALYELDGWGVSEDYLQIQGEQYLSWHYQYQGPFDLLPSNQFSTEEVEKKGWDNGIVNHLQADLWIHPDGYLIKQIIIWDVTFTLSDGSTASGKEKIVKEISKLDQELLIPEMIVPPVPVSLSSPWVGRWLYYGDPQGTWTYQLGKLPEDILSIYNQSEIEGFEILEQDGSSQSGYDLIVQAGDGITWEIKILPQEGEKGGIISLLVMHQQ